MPKRPCDSATGSSTPRASQSVSASRSNVNAQAARACLGQGGSGWADGTFVIAGLILADGATRGQTLRARGISVRGARAFRGLSDG